tara:strand:+ start:165 stop:521 length:357 start_codon:yes stop_codon:yes gene_type:complete
MIKLIIGFFISFLFLFPVNSAFSKEIPQKNIDNLTNKVAKKFSRTFCNTSNFGISDEGAIEFALGETKKEFSKNKLIEYINFKEMNKKIITNIEADCQVFDFPVDELAQLESLKINDQ